jgi:hypothetical protein
MDILPCVVTAVAAAAAAAAGHNQKVIILDIVLTSNTDIIFVQIMSRTGDWPEWLETLNISPITDPDTAARGKQTKMSSKLIQSCLCWQK